MLVGILYPSTLKKTNNNNSTAAYILTEAEPELQIT